MVHELKDTLKHIQNNVKYLDKYDADKIICTLNKRIVQETLNVTLEDSGQIYNSNVKHIDMYITDTELLLKSVTDAIVSKFDSLENYHLYNNCHSIFYFNYFRHVSDNTYKISNDVSFLDLLYFLRYIVYGKFDSDYSIVHEIEKSLKFELVESNGFTRKQAYNIKLDDLNIRIKKYKNGRLDIICSDEITNKIVNMFGFMEKYKKRN